MQLSAREYSKATVGLRQPDKIMNQPFKLVFIYPMLVDTKLLKYSNLIRSFISTSMLKEIYTANALNIISMAGNISPLVDEVGNLVDIEGGDNESALKGYVKRETQQSVKYDIEKRVEEKTLQISKMLNIDPVLKQYNPLLQLITLNNFIDVPVIVGTKSYQVQSYIFLFLFAMAISSKGSISMSSYTDIERMFRVLTHMDTNNINVLLNNLIDLPNKDVFDRLSDWYSDHPRISRSLRNIGFSWINTPASWVQTAGRKLLPKTDKLSRQPLSGETVDYPAVNPDLAGKILDITQNDVQQASVFFKLVMDSDTMASQFGYDKGKGQLKKTFDRINPRLNEVFDNTEIYFTNVLWTNYIAPTLSSFFYAIIPTKSGINVSDLIIALQNGDESKNIKPLVQPLIEFLKGDFKTTLNNVLERQGPEKADETLSRIKSICQNYFEDSHNILTRLDSIHDSRLTGPDFSVDDLISYEKKFEESIISVSAFTATIDGVLRNILPNSVVDDIMNNKTVEKINDALNSVVAYLATFQDYPSSSSFIIQLGIDPGNQSREISKYISQTKKQLMFYIRFMFLKAIIYLLCQYVKETKVAIETTKHDVLDSNNYTIVTSVENIFAVANAFVAKSYKDLINKASRTEDGKFDTRLARDLSGNYVKGVIKHMHKQLEVPNLIVIDEKKQDVYYKLMYQSNVNKIKLNTMQTFVNTVLK